MRAQSHRKWAWDYTDACYSELVVLYLHIPRVYLWATESRLHTVTDLFSTFLGARRNSPWFQDPKGHSWHFGMNLPVYCAHIYWETLHVQHRPAVAVWTAIIYLKIEAYYLKWNRRYLKKHPGSFQHFATPICADQFNIFVTSPTTVMNLWSSKPEVGLALKML